MKRHRGLLFASLVAIVALGLGSRLYASRLSPAVGLYGGDTLWATAVFVTLGLVWPAARTFTLALAAALTSLAVELSQLAHPAWLETLRGLPGVGLVIGYDFVWTDLACYAIGVALGVGLDRALSGRYGRPGILQETPGRCAQTRLRSSNPRTVRGEDPPRR